MTTAPAFEVRIGPHGIESEATKSEADGSLSLQTNADKPWQLDISSQKLDLSTVELEQIVAKGV